MRRGAVGGWYAAPRCELALKSGRRLAKRSPVTHIVPVRNVATIHTLGYEKRDLAAYTALLKRAGVSALVDVRETAWSHKPGFSKTAFRAGLERAGIRYIHAKAVGNPKALRRRARSHEECLALFETHLEKHPHLEEEFDRILRDLLVEELRICLACFERHPDDCHRGILADRWAKRHRGRVEHLASDGCPRLVSV